MKYQQNRREENAGRSSPPAPRRSPGDDPMETFDMVNRHTDRLIRQAEKRRRKAASAGAPSAKKDARPSAAGKKKGSGRQRRPAERRVEREELIRRNVSRHRIRHKKNYILYYLLLLFLFLTVGVTLSLTVFFRIDAIQVEGGGDLPAEGLIAASGVKKEDNLFRVNTKRAETSILSQFITVDSVKVSRKLPGTLVIHVEPSRLMAVARYDGRYYSVSKGSRVTAIGEERPEDTGVPVVIGCDYSDVELGDYLNKLDVGRTKLETMEAVLEGVEENSLMNVGYVDLTDVAFIKLYYEDRLELKMGGLTDFSYELSRVKHLIQTKVPQDGFGVIDATLHNGTYSYRDTGAIALPGGEEPAARPRAESAAGYDLPGGERDEDAQPAGE